MAVVCDAVSDMKDFRSIAPGLPVKSPLGIILSTVAPARCANPLISVSAPGFNTFALTS